MLSRAIERNLSKVEEYKNASRIVFFISKKNEIDTKKMIETKIKTACVMAPKVKGKEIEIYRINNPKKDLIKGTFNVMEPRAGLSKEEPRLGDVVVVPGILFDLDGYRIGYGGGYYDRFLKKVQRQNRIGIIHSKFLIKKIVREKHDVPVGIVVTEKEVIYTSVQMRKRVFVKKSEES